jgi:hypothetical protein
MPVVEQIISARIRTFIEKQKQNEDTEQAVQDFSNELAAIIKEAILSATVTAAPGSIVVVGSPATQTNPTPIIFQIT